MARRKKYPTKRSRSMKLVLAKKKLAKELALLACQNQTTVGKELLTTVPSNSIKIENEPIVEPPQMEELKQEPIDIIDDDSDIKIEKCRYFIKSEAYTDIVQLESEDPLSDTVKDEIKTEIPDNISSTMIDENQKIQSENEIKAVNFPILNPWSISVENLDETLTTYRPIEDKIVNNDDSTQIIICDNQESLPPTRDPLGDIIDPQTDYQQFLIGINSTPCHNNKQKDSIECSSLIKMKQPSTFIIGEKQKQLNSSLVALKNTVNSIESSQPFLINTLINSQHNKIDMNNVAIKCVNLKEVSQHNKFNAVENQKEIYAVDNPLEGLGSSSKEVQDGSVNVKNEKFKTSQPIKKAVSITCADCDPPTNFLSFKEFKIHVASKHQQIEIFIQNKSNINNPTPYYLQPEPSLSLKPVFKTYSKKKTWACTICKLSNIESEAQLTLHIKTDHKDEVSILSESFPNNVSVAEKNDHIDEERRCEQKSINEKINKNWQEKRIRTLKWRLSVITKRQKQLAKEAATIKKTLLTLQKNSAD